ncbi:protein-disulfide reductase DsbD domain-containing protein [Shimia sp. MMG029]|uniref:protein-disulfide reductase DsbD domain-containing protein n=1 Tax=Shimia sp. MMG029 TaxID=3021978 RepID=UPI0022FEA27A|nr:protein-disulfide reductase DsbD domain-containing protein [Shimia sp. MMG029]MDA5558307.1 protein-disulfide reductase DsbD family protein [Shimia sp. MMG029]
MFKTIAHCLAPLCALVLPAMASAQSFDQVVQAEVLPGWRNADGTHMAGVRITLNPGWKTYWRAPGDAGIPPQISWRGSRNVGDLAISWPTPDVFYENGMRSIGYSEDLVLPVKIAPIQAGKPVRLKAVLDIGVCREICVPQRLKIDGELAAPGARDARIVASIVDQPLSAEEAGVHQVTCTLTPSEDGIKLQAKIKMPRAGADEVAVIETANPEIWVAEGTTKRSGDTLVAETEMMHVSDASFLINRADLRFTVLSTGEAVDIHGCTG